MKLIFILIALMLFTISSGICQVTKEDLKDAFNRVANAYENELIAKSSKLSFRYKPKDGAVGARINFLGELTVYGTDDYGILDKNSLTLIMCHEVGHTLGGMPYLDPLFVNGFLSSEGQADYFASMKCLPKILRSEYAHIPLLPLPQERYFEECSKTHTDEFSIAICTQVIEASYKLATYFQYTRDREIQISIDKRTEEISSVTRYFKDNLNYYPSSQCRFETYLAGALCVDDPNNYFSDAYTFRGSECQSMNMISKRPNCWFKEPTQKQQDFFAWPWSGESEAFGQVRFKLNPSRHHLAFGEIEYSDGRYGNCNGNYRATYNNNQLKLKTTTECSGEEHDFFITIPLFELLNGKAIDVEISNSLLELETDNLQLFLEK